MKAVEAEKQKITALSRGQSGNAAEGNWCGHGFVWIGLFRERKLA